MREVRLHGRGGQGAVLASKILAKALVLEGFNVMAIPSFGFERRGAPVVCYLRFADAEIRAVTNIYTPDTILSIDPTVGRAVDIFAGMRAGGTLIQATKKPLTEVSRPDHVRRVALCDAVGIARDLFGRPITNTVMLGAYAKATGIVSLKNVEAALETANFRDAALDQNREAVDRGYAETQVFDLNEAAA